MDRTAPGLVLLVSACMSAACAAAPEPRQPPAAEERAHRALVAEIAAEARGRGTPGKALVVSDLGFDPADSTRFLQAALDSGADRILVPAAPGPWISGPLRVRRGLTLVLEAGAVIEAKRGEFKGRGDCLLSAENVQGLSIIGYGAIIRMWKADYQAPPYEPSEWRHAISLRGCKDVVIAGLWIKDSGGDGVYIGASSRLAECVDVTLKDLRISGHHRQGVSVISATRLLIENCDIWGTRGTLPASGIDFEPNTGTPGFVDCVVRGSRLWDNDGWGLLIVLGRLTADNRPVSILVEDCVIDDPPFGLFVSGLDQGLKGSLRLRATKVSGLVWAWPTRDFDIVIEP